MMLFHKTLFPLYALVFAPIFPSLMFEMCENYVHSSAQAFNFANETIIMIQPSIDVDFVVGTTNREMGPTILPSFAPPVADYSTESVDLGYCVKTLKQEMEPVIMSLTSELFDAVNSNFELVRKNLEAFTNKLPSAADLFAIINAKLEHIGELAMIQANGLMTLTSELFDAASSNFELVRKNLEAFTNKLPSAANLFAIINTKLEHIRELGMIQANDLMSLTSELFDAVSSNFELVCKNLEAFINKLPSAADLFASINAKLEHIGELMIQANDLFDSMSTNFEGFLQKFFSCHDEAMNTIRAKYEELFSESYEVIVQFFSDPYEIFGQHGIIHFSSAPMVTGNLTGSAINLGRINDDSMLEFIPTIGCTIPVFSLDFILELTDLEVFIKSFSKQEGNASSSFILESLDQSWAVLESIVSRVLDRFCSLGYLQVSEKLESIYNEYFSAATPTPPSSWVGQLFVTACKKLEALVGDFFAPPPPPTMNFQIFAMKSLNTMAFVCIFLAWHAINRN